MSLKNRPAGFEVLETFARLARACATALGAFQYELVAESTIAPEAPIVGRSKGVAADAPSVKSPLTLSVSAL